MKHGLCLFILFLLVGQTLTALEEREVPFTWKPVEGAGAYKIEVMNEKGEQVFLQTVKESEELKVILKLYPSKYSLRLTTINRFMQPEASTPWKTFSIPAAAPPLFGTLEPARQTWGDLKALSLQGQDLAGDLSAELVGKDGRHYPLSGEAQDRDHWVFQPPSDMDPGHYDLILTNPPRNAVTQSEAFTVLVTQPLVTSLQPNNFRIDHAPKVLMLNGSRFFEGVQVFLISDNPATGKQKIALKIISRNFDGLKLAWPDKVDVGEYRLEAVNGEVGYPAVAALRVDEPLAPVIDSVSKTLIRNSNLPLSLTLTGTDFSPEAVLWLVKDSGLFVTERRVKMNVTFVDNKTLKGELSAKDAPLELGGWHLELMNEPGRRIVLGPKIEVAEDPISRQLRFAVGWDASMALSDWAVIYSLTPIGGNFNVAYYFSEHKRPIDGYVWDFGAQLDLDGVYFGESWNKNKIASTLLGISAMAGPVVELSWLPVTFRLHAGGGAVFTSLEVTLGNVSHQKLLDQEIMPMAGAGLGVEIPLNDLFRVELGCDWHHYFFVQPMDMMRGSVKAVVAIPTK